MAHLLVLQGRTINQRHADVAVKAIRDAQVVVLPTETGYCFAGLAHRKAIHQKLWELRQAHPKSKPFSLLCPDAKAVAAVARVSTPAYRLMNKLLPGPFTLILPVNKETPNFSTGTHKNTIGIRIPSHPVAQCILAAVDTPLVVTSVTDADELEQEGYTESSFDAQLERWWTSGEGIDAHTKGQLSLVIGQQDPLPLRHSTVIDLSDNDVPRVIRDGGWPLSGIDEGELTRLGATR
jgi:tRNA threonylcarbamoyl adenosine modification protein (Sua5/YciO/YrdC/YwlC family)